MSKLMALKLIMATFVLLWFGSPTIAQQLRATTGTPCVTKVVDGVCSIALLADTEKCCKTVLNETKADRECMCTAFDSDSDFLSSFMFACSDGVTYNQVIKICQDYLIAQKTIPSSDTPSSPSSDLLSPPSRSDIFSPPASSTKSAGSSPVHTPPPLTSSGTGNKMIITVVVTVVITIVVIIIIGASIFCICRGRKKTRQNTSLHPYNPYPYNVANVEVVKNQGLSSHHIVSSHVPPVAPIPMSTVSQQSSSVSINKDGFKTDGSLQYEFAILQAATDNFSDDNIIGRGGFGSVYKGTLLDERKIARTIAVKRLSQESCQGGTEFKAEIELLAKLQQRNLVQLLGFCFKEKEALLVYEFVPNKSLDYFLFDDTKREELKWPIRFQIIKGVAQGLLYLHDGSHQRTIHRDLKAPNVLLDAEMNPKIADFGLARICAVEQTHVYTRNIAGTGDYISPEYRYRGQFSTKSDVYAFGALVLEIISGRSIGSQAGELAENLMGFAWRCWTDGNPLALMDPMLKDSFSSDEVGKCIHLGILCVHDDVDKRPDMSTVVHKLNSKTEVGIPQQGFIYNSSSDQSTTTSTTSQSVTTSSTKDGSFLAWPQQK